MYVSKLADEKKHICVVKLCTGIHPLLTPIFEI